MRIAVVVVLVALAVAACSREPDGDGPRFVEISDSDSSDGDEESIYNEVPYGAGVEVGGVYDYELGVHCGVRWARIDGALWAADPPDEGSGSSPDGWGDPIDSGTLTVIDETNAEYRNGSGTTVRFVRTDLTEAPVNCR